MADLNLLKFGLELNNKGLSVYIPTANPDRNIEYLIVSDGTGVLLVDHSYGRGLRLSLPVWDCKSQCMATTMLGRFDNRLGAHRQTPATADNITLILPLFKEQGYPRLLRGTPFLIRGKHGIFKDWSEYYRLASQEHDLTPIRKYLTSRGMTQQDVSHAIDIELHKKNPTENENL